MPLLDHRTLNASIEDERRLTGQRTIVAALAMLGVALWLWVGVSGIGKPISTSDKIIETIKLSVGKRQLLAYALAIALAVLPPTRRALSSLFDKLSSPSKRSRFWIAMALSIVSIAYLYFTARYQGRDLFAKWHDEFMYLVQAQLLAKGKLWLPGHPLGEFFESFYLFVQPKYASQSFPGVSLLFVPAVWLHLGKWVIPLIISAACVGLIYRIVTELVDGKWGLLAALFVLGLRVFRFQSMMAMANVPMLFFALVMTLGWLKWRAHGQWRWAAVIGIAAGWAGITRPADAMCVAIPIGLAMLWDLYDAAKANRVTDEVGRVIPVPRVSSLGVVVACAIPFLVLQAIFNIGITGKVTKMPFSYYNDLYYPQQTLGMPVYDPTLKPQTNILQKTVMYETWGKSYILAHQPDNWARTWVKARIPEAFETTTPVGILLVYLPIGLLAMTDRRRWVVVILLPAFLILYGVYTIFMSQYCCLAIPAVLVLIVLGAKKVEETYALGGLTRVAIPLCFIVACVYALPEFSGRTAKGEFVIQDDRGHDMPVMELNTKLAELIKEPAVVLYRFGPEMPADKVHEEPAYNIDVAWPDDARIIRAHDLGEKNALLFKYYAEKDPERVIYRIDRADPELKIVRLGTAKELAK